MRLFRAFIGAFIMPLALRIFYPERVFRGKRIAVIGAADSAFSKDLGDYIDSFDVVIRINKALVSWNVGNERFIGTRTDILFHSFFENLQSGGGALDFGLFRKRHVGFIVNPISSVGGLRLNYNFYKKYLSLERTYILSPAYYREMMRPFGNLRPTIGYAALYSALSSNFDELYITGFTFFRTPYAAGYRDDLVDMESNKKHIASQGLHDPDLEFREFKRLVHECRGRVIMDDMLTEIMNIKD